MAQMNLWAEDPDRALRAAEPGAGPPEQPSATALQYWLAAQLGRPVHLVITRNRSTMMSCREGEEGLRLRLHGAFLAAAPEVHRALAVYLDRDDPEAGRVLDAFVASLEIDTPRRRMRLRPRGRSHDLDEIIAELNQTYFHGASRARITWGSAGTRRRRRSIQLGCYVREDQLIRIHPCLDQSFVPRFYVAWVVFHEMLHEIFGFGSGGPGSVHPPEFAAIEETYPDYQRCKLWEEQHLERLLRFRAPKRRSRR